MGNYGLISRPLHDLLPKDLWIFKEYFLFSGFHWSKVATQAFQQLKDSMITAPTLAILSSAKTFELEIDASSQGIGVVLMQQGHPTAFINKSLGPRHQGLSVYEKELLAILFALEKWHHYPIIGHFIIRTDYQRINCSIGVRLNTPT